MSHPRFSICVCAYNDEAYVRDCLTSVLSQSFADFQLVCVDDGSSDGTGEILSEFASADDRVCLHSKQRNEGVHLGRMDAVASARGDYLLFLDSDDELLPGSLLALSNVLDEHPCDYLHFGAQFIADGVNAGVAARAEAQANQSFEVHSGRDLMHLAYDVSGGCVLDWRVWQRVYATPLVQHAFSLMPRVGLGRGQDSFEHLVIAALSKQPFFANDVVAYRYYLGRGVTSSSRQTPEAWLKTMRAYADVVGQAHRFARVTGDDHIEIAASGLEEKLVENLFNDLSERIDSEQFERLTLVSARYFSSCTVGSQLARLVRDRAYGLLVNGDSIDADPLLVDQLACAERIIETGGDPSSPAAHAYLEPARSHVKDLIERSTGCGGGGCDRSHTRTLRSAVKALGSRLRRRA